MASHRSPSLLCLATSSSGISFRVGTEEEEEELEEEEVEDKEVVVFFTLPILQCSRMALAFADVCALMEWNLAVASVPAYLRSACVAGAEEGRRGAEEGE